MSRQLDEGILDTLVLACAVEDNSRESHRSLNPYAVFGLALRGQKKSGQVQ